MANKLDLIAKMKSNAENNSKPFSLENIQGSEPDFSLGFENQSLDEADKKDSSNESDFVRNQFKIPEPEEVTPNPHVSFNRDKGESGKQLEIKKDESAADFGKDVGKSFTNDMFKIPEIEEDLGDVVEEKLPTETESFSDMFKIPELSEEVPEDNSSMPIETLAESNKVDSAKEEKQEVPVLEEIKKSENLESKNKVSEVINENKDSKSKNKETVTSKGKNLTMNETDKKILLQIISQTDPNFENLSFLGEDYLNNLWGNLKNLIVE